jgi:hypothetical protein
MVTEEWAVVGIHDEALLCAAVIHGTFHHMCGSDLFQSLKILHRMVDHVFAHRVGSQNAIKKYKYSELRK